MDSVFARYRNLTILVVVLFIQLVALATQVKRQADPERPEAGTVSLLRLWTVSVLTPFQKAFVGSSAWGRGLWHEYVDLRGVRAENQRLLRELEELRLLQVRMSEDAVQGRRLQALLDFKEQFAHKTVAAQVIGSSGSDKSRTVYIDKGSNDGLEPDMAVVTPHGIVGKVIRVFPNASLVLLLNDMSAGAGVILEESRLRGILKGRPNGEVVVRNIMSDDEVQVGERVLTTGGDRVFPRGLPVGSVARVYPDHDNPPFLAVEIKMAANLNRLEEVLVITKITERPIRPDEISSPLRASDILAERLPGVSRRETAPAAQLPAAQGATTARPPAQSAPATSTPAAQSGPATTNRPRPAESRAPEQRPANGTQNQEANGNAARPTATPPQPQVQPQPARPAAAEEPAEPEPGGRP